MAEINNIIKTKVKKFVDELRNENINIERAILYGSYAKGTYNEWSDIDIAVVSKDFKGIRLFDKERMIKAIAKVDYGISPLPFRPEDFDESNLFVKEILETGIRII